MASLPLEQQSSMFFREARLQRQLDAQFEAEQTALLVEGLKDTWSFEEVWDSEESLNRALKELTD